MRHSTFLLLISALVPHQHPITATALIVRELGNMEMELQSSQNSETNLLLRTLLSVTVNFLDAAFFTATDSTFQQVSCSIKSFQLFDGKAKNAVSNQVNALYSANITITGQAFFLEGTNFTQNNVSELTAVSFVNNKDFLQALHDSEDPFLASVKHAVFKVNGATVAAENEETGNSTASGSNNGNGMETWMIALVVGAAAFLLVTCTMVTCICCMTVNDEHDMRKEKMSHPMKDQLEGTGAYPPSDLHIEDDGEDFAIKSPISGKSIGSQDSSTFTYNPKSVMSFDSRTISSFFTSNTAEMDIAAWQSGSVINQNQISFGQDISDIEKKNDLSLIQEGEDESTSSPVCISETPNKGKYRSLLSSGNDNSPQLYLTEAALNDMELGERSVQLKHSRSGNSTSVGHKIMAKNSSPAADDDDNSYYGPSLDEGTSTPCINLKGPAADVLSDLNDLSSQIDQFRGRRSLPPPE